MPLRQPAGSSSDGAHRDTHRGAEGQGEDAAAHALGLPVVVRNPHLRAGQEALKSTEP
jgi:hypothetical protein